jgi:aminocarboxymuconate-semialdehyde decarboxylase
MSLLRGPIDVHAHVVPEEFIDRVSASGRPGFTASKQAGGSARIQTGERARPSTVMHGLYSVDERLRTMDEEQVAVQVLAPPASTVNTRFPEDDAIWVTEALNASISDLVAEHSDRFLGLGGVPLQAPERAAELLRKAVEQQGLKGALIAATPGPDRDLDEAALEPFWAAAESLGAWIFIHPQAGVRSPRFDQYHLSNLIQNPLDTTIAAAHLIFGGVMQRHPGLRVCLAHGGGLLPYDVGRLSHGYEAEAEVRVALTESVEDSFRRFYYDTVTHSSAVLKFLIDSVGIEHVLLGTDYPYTMGDSRPLATIDGAALSGDETALVHRGNAERLFDLG